MYTSFQKDGWTTLLIKSLVILKTWWHFVIVWIRQPVLLRKPFQDVKNELFIFCVEASIYVE